MRLAERLEASMSQIAGYEAGQDKSEIKKNIILRSQSSWHQMRILMDRLRRLKR